MIKSKAIKAMKEGKKVTHPHFTDQEWMTMQGGKIVFEDGFRCDWLDFWFYRTDESWNSGYSIFQDNKTSD